MRRHLPPAVLLVLALLGLASAAGVASAQVSGGGTPGGFTASVGRTEAGPSSTPLPSVLEARTIPWSPTRTAVRQFSRRPLGQWVSNPLLLFVLRRQQLL